MALFCENEIIHCSAFELIAPEETQHKNLTSFRKLPHERAQQRAPRAILRAVRYSVGAADRKDFDESTREREPECHLVTSSHTWFVYFSLCKSSALAFIPSGYCG